MTDSNSDGTQPKWERLPRLPPKSSQREEIRLILRHNGRVFHAFFFCGLLICGLVLLAILLGRRSNSASNHPPAFAGEARKLFGSPQ